MQTASEGGGHSSLLASLKEAIAGTGQDFTEGSIGRAILLLSVPMVLEMSMESLFAVIDIFFVARLGADAVAAVGLTEAVLTLIFAVAAGLSTATTAMVARRIGEKRPVEAAAVAAQSIFLGLAIALPVGWLGIAFAPRLLALMGATSQTIEEGSGYFAVMFGGNLVIMLLFLLNAVLRGAGDAAIAMRVLLVANGLNLILDPLLIFGIGPFPELGVTGAAAATTTGRGIGVLYQLYILFAGTRRIRLTRDSFVFRPGIVLRLARISLGGIFQYLIATSSWIGLVRIISVFGSEALAGYTVALRILIFALLPAWGMSNATATLVGQNLGAGKPERAEGAVHQTGAYCMLFLALVAVILIAWAERFFRFFVADEAVIPLGVECLRYLSYGNVFYGLGMVMSQTFNGAGDTYTPTWINFFCYWLFQIPLSYVMALPLGMGPSGVFIAIPVSESAVAIVGFILFRRGRWKARTV